MMSYQQARCRLVSANEKRSKTCIAMRVLKGAVVTYFPPSPKKTNNNNDAGTGTKKESNQNPLDPSIPPPQKESIIGYNANKKPFSRNSNNNNDKRSLSLTPICSPVPFTPITHSEMGLRVGESLHFLCFCWYVLAFLGWIWCRSSS
jgi:hypothetical protein